MFNWFDTCKKYRAIQQIITPCIDKDIIELPTPILPETELGKSLRRRRSKRQFKACELSIQELSNLLWCANGVNMELGEGKVLHTAPSASNHQEIDLYVFDVNGCYKYKPISHGLETIFKGDVRSYIGTQPFVEKAPVIIAIVADYSRMIHHNNWKKHRYSCVDAGYISQNIYLYCAASKLSTVACGKINHELIKKIIQLKNGDVLLCHPIG